jgi:hypothetical protein
MMSSMAWGTSHPITPIESHPLPHVPVSGQPHGAASFSHTVVACPYVLQVMMTPLVRTFCRRLGNARAHLANI